MLIKICGNVSETFFHFLAQRNEILILVGRCGEGSCKQINGNLVKQLEGDEGFIKFFDSLKGLRQELDHK